MTDFNRQPYFDDHDYKNNHKKVLFKAGFPVQTRELNEIQSIFYSEIGAFADHIFKNGSKVSNCRAALTKKDYVRLMPNDVNSNPLIKPEGVIKLVGETSGIEATLLNYVESDSSDPITIYVMYTKNGGDNGEVSKFIPGENIIVKDEYSVELYRWTVRCPSCPMSTISPEISPVGYGYYFVVDDGIIYYNKMFVSVTRQEILITKYIEKNNDGYEVNPESFKIGLDFKESVLSVLDDSNLYDNSLGYPNVGAEGADRYKVELKLVKREYDAEDGDKFILLAKVKPNYTIEYTKADSEYNEIMKEIARRTYEQSGNFTVSPFTATFVDEKKNSPTDPNGWSVNGSDEKLVAIVKSGIAYVGGERISPTGDTIVPFNKARDTDKKDKLTSHIKPFKYVSVDVVSTNHIVNNTLDESVISTRVIQLYDDVISSGDVSGVQIGTMKCIDQSYLGDNEYILYVYDIDITSNTKTFGDVRSMKTSDNQFVASATLTDGTYKVFNSDKDSLIYPVADNLVIKSLRSIDDTNAGSINVQVRRKLTGTTNSSGIIQFNTSSNESFSGYNPYHNIFMLNGSKVILSPSQISINNTVMVIDVGSGNANKSVVFYATIDKYEQKEKTKTLVSSVFTTTAAPSGSIGDIINLDTTDGFKLTSVKIVNPSDTNFNDIDVTSEYKFINGQTNLYYGESKIERITTRTGIVPTWRLEVEYQYFEHVGTEGYFTIDSYSELINTNQITYEELVNYVNNLPAATFVDFRPQYVNDTFVNPVIPTQGSTFVTDIEYYLPRVDILQIAKDGTISVKEGSPSLQPKAPSVDNDNMLIYEIHLNAYTFDVKKDVNVKFIDNKRYTMKDINSIENRLTNLEYYTALNLLEQKTANMNILDPLGNNRFKNGFIVDSFNTFDAADIENEEYKASIDRSRGELRPKFKMYNIDMIVDKTQSTNVRFFDNVAMLPYDEVEFMGVPFATKHISINPYLIFNKVGVVSLSPNVDTWSDDEQLPNIVASIDTGVDTLKTIADKTKLLGTDWQSWVDLNTTTQRSTNTIVTDTQIQTITNVTTNTLQQRTGKLTTIDSRTDTYSVEDVVKDVKLVPYIRSRIVDFYAAKLKPRTKVFVYFDGVNVTEHCRVKRQVDLNTNMVDYTIFGGSPLITNDDGELIGEFLIPSNTFFVGEKDFIITDDELMSGSDSVTTSAKTKYYAGGISQTKQTSTLNIITPVYNESTVTENQTISNSSRDVSITQRPTPPAPAPAPSQNVINTNLSVLSPFSFGNSVWVRNWFNSLSRPNLRGDPVAQAFKVDESCFLTRIDIYFKSIDFVTNDNVWVEVRTMINGYPSTEVIARKSYSPSELDTYQSNDSNKAFPVTFDIPFYVDSGKTYCFVVGGYSPDTRIWVCKLGEEVVNIQGKFVEEPPTVYPSFRSLNGSTWNAEQTEFIKHKLYHANFKTNTMNVILENEAIKPKKVDIANPIEIQSGINRVRLHIDNHGLGVNDRVSVSLLDNVPLIIEVVNSTPPQIGQYISTSSGSGYVESVKSLPTLNYFEITLSQVQGVILTNQSFQCDSMVKSYNTFLLLSNGLKPRSNIQVSECQGFTRSNLYDSVGYTTIGNVGLENFNKEHVVIEVDSIDSVIVEVSGTFTSSGRFGNNMYVVCNRTYNTFNLSAEYMSYGSTENITVSNINPSYQIVEDRQIKLNTDMYTNSPLLMATHSNENRVFGNVRNSSKVKISLTTNNNLISPVVNTDSVSLTYISNHIGDNTSLKMNVSPNATNRFIDDTFNNSSSTMKHFMNDVTLNKPASDLKIYIDVYKDITADFDVYVKAANAQTTNYDSIQWKKIDGIDKSVSSNGIDDFIEYSMSVVEDCSSWNLDEFVWFKVKIVSKASNSSKPPLFKNLRAIAVT